MLLHLIIAIALVLLIILATGYMIIREIRRDRIREIERENAFVRAVPEEHKRFVPSRDPYYM